MRKMIFYTILLIFVLQLGLNAIEPANAVSPVIKIDAGNVRHTHTDQIGIKFSCKYSYLGKKIFPLKTQRTFQWKTYEDKSKPNFLYINGVDSSQSRIITSVVKNLPLEISKNLKKAYEEQFQIRYECLLFKKGQIIYAYETYGIKKMPVYKTKTSMNVLQYYWKNLRPTYLKKWYFYNL